MEKRLDRIEKSIEGLLRGIAELRESQKTTDKHILELKESQKKTDEQLRLTIKKLDDVGRQLGDQGLVQGEVAEELFYRNVGSLFKPMDFRFNRIRRNLKVKGSGEYDIVAEDGGRVLVLEIKNKLEKRLIDAFLTKKLPRFKVLMPQYRDLKVLGGVGALVVKDDVGRYAEKAGLFVLTQANDGGAALLNKKGFKPKEFV
jgi:hypothetical protein